MSLNAKNEQNGIRRKKRMNGIGMLRNESVWRDEAKWDGWDGWDG